MMEKCGMTRSLSFLWRDAKVFFFLTKFSGGFIPIMIWENGVSN